jgi:hypothetical protein
MTIKSTNRILTRNGRKQCKMIHSNSKPENKVPRNKLNEHTIWTNLKKGKLLYLTIYHEAFHKLENMSTEIPSPNQNLIHLIKEARFPR